MSGDEGYIRTWSRHKDPASRSGVESLLCIGDVLPPAAMPLMRSFAPVSSMSWMFNLLTDNPQTEDGWWHIESRLTSAAGGLLEPSHAHLEHGRGASRRRASIHRHF